jgi:hypothetical protein
MTSLCSNRCNFRTRRRRWKGIGYSFLAGSNWSGKSIPFRLSKLVLHVEIQDNYVGHAVGVDRLQKSKLASFDSIVPVEKEHCAAILCYFCGVLLYSAWEGHVGLFVSWSCVIFVGFCFTPHGRAMSAFLFHLVFLRLIFALCGFSFSLSRNAAMLIWGRCWRHRSCWKSRSSSACLCNQDWPT